jgi:hypothetical protein
LDFSLIKKASPGLKDFTLYFPLAGNFESCLDAIFGLNQITTIYLYWNQLSMEMIKTALKKQGGKKRWEIVDLGDFDREMNDTNLLEICSYLPRLREWSGSSTIFTLTIYGVREWKRICPLLEIFHFLGDEGLSEEVKEEMKGLGITVEEY